MRFNKTALVKDLKDEYLRLNRPLANCSVTDLIQRVEIELSKHASFRVMELSYLDNDVLKHNFVISILNVCVCDCVCVSHHYLIVKAADASFWSLAES